MPQPTLLDQVRQAIRLRHYSIRTEEAYVNTIRRFIIYHNKRHPREMGADEIRQYLSHLAVEGNVAASTQNVALSALLFLYRRHTAHRPPPYRRRRARQTPAAGARSANT
jgi:site-specific recombinase XerD